MVSVKTSVSKEQAEFFATKTFHALVVEDGSSEQR